MCHKDNLARSNYEKGNKSATDFAYALALCRRGCDHAEISQRIITERQNWKNHHSPKKMQDYLNRTIANALKIIAQN